jgi:hypothetical protein
MSLLRNRKCRRIYEGQIEDQTSRMARFVARLGSGLCTGGLPETSQDPVVTGRPGTLCGQ